MLVNRQTLFLLAMLVVSIGYVVSAVSLGSPIGDSGVTPSFFPIVVGTAAVIFSSLLIMQQMRAADDEKEAGPARYTHIWVVATIFVYIFAFLPVGYFLSSTVFVFVLITLFSSFEKLFQKALLSVAVVLAGYGMFQLLFGVRLPTLWG